MLGLPILSTLLAVPLVGVLVLFFAEGEGETGHQQARRLALGFSIATFGMAMVMLYNFNPALPGFQLEEHQAWIPALGMAYHLGVDGISIWLVVLVTLLVPFAIIASWDSIQTRVREFMIAVLLFEALVIGTFSALDLVLFYLFYEGNLIPMFLLIGGWGEERRGAASFKFVLFNMVGSVFLLVAILVIGNLGGSFDIPALIKAPPSAQLQTWLWLAMFVSFAIKMPLWPVHTWLPEVHVAAPTAASMLIAGLHMKLGTYGFLRLLLPLLPDASDMFAPLVMVLGAITIVQNSLVAFTQVHLKRMLAYATVAHMGMTAIGVFSRTVESIQGTILMIFVQGLVFAGLFMCVGVLHERFKTYDADRIAGVIAAMPRFSFVVLMLIMGAVALPGSGNFIGELLILVGAFKASTIIAVIAGSAIILAPVYFLGNYHRIIFAPTRSLAPAGIADLSGKQQMAFGCALVIVFWLGIHPPPFLSGTATAVSSLVASQHFHHPSLALAASEMQR